MSHDQSFTADLTGGSTEAQQLLDAFWPKVVEDIKGLTPNDFKTQELPLARIKKIMKLDDDVKAMVSCLTFIVISSNCIFSMSCHIELRQMISAEAPVLFAKAAEIFITELSLRAWIHTEDNKRRTLQRNDIAMAITKYDQFDFLIDIVPRDEVAKPQTKRSNSHSGTSLSLTDPATGAQIPADQLQYMVNPFQSTGGQIQFINTANGLQMISAPQTSFPGQQLLQLQVPSNAGVDGASGAPAGQLQYQLVTPNGEVSQIPLNQLLRMQLQGQQGMPNQPILIQTPGNPGSYQIAGQGGQQFILGQQPSSQDEQTNDGLDEPDQ